MPQEHAHPALFNLGFRPFFAGASFLAIVSIAYWLGVYLGFLKLPLENISPFQWHAHEMIYGYGLAVIAGFLLTAVKNWTGKQTPHGYSLAALFACWASARVFWFLGESLLPLAAAFDLIFMILLIFAIAVPIVAVKQWRQLAILSKLFLLGIGNLLFYAETLGPAEAIVASNIQIALYGGVYLIIGLVLTIGRRIIPLFIQNGVDYQVSLFNSRWLDIPSLLCFLGFFISELFFDALRFSQLMAISIFLITTARIIGWYTPGAWKNPLLWCFYIALFFIDLGFLLFALSEPLQLSPYIHLHAFAVGTIGVITMGMMARVSTGHTGRSLKAIPKSVFFSLYSLSIAAVIRVLLPVLFPSLHTLWIGLSGLLWLIAFTLFFSTFLPYWTKPRVDEKYG